MRYGLSLVVLLVAASVQAITVANHLKVDKPDEYGLGVITLHFVDGTKSLLKPNHYLRLEKENILRMGKVQVAKAQADHAWDDAWKTQKLPHACFRRLHDGWSLYITGIKNLNCAYRRDKS